MRPSVDATLQGAQASRLLVSASRRNALWKASIPKESCAVFQDLLYKPCAGSSLRRDASASTRDGCAPRICPAFALRSLRFVFWKRFTRNALKINRKPGKYSGAALQTHRLLVTRLQPGNAVVFEAPASKLPPRKFRVLSASTLARLEPRSQVHSQAGAWERGITRRAFPPVFFLAS